MGHTRASARNLHRRLTVAWLDDAARSRLADSLTSDVVHVDQARLDELAGPAAVRRRELEAVTDVSLEEELTCLDAERTAAELALEELLTEQRRIREAADWCEHQPERDSADREQISVLEAEMDAHSGRARESTRRLERVLEQRAAAEAALEDARRELTGLGATGIDETDVRRQMEAASHDLRAATTEYQEAMKEVARRRAALEELEAAATRAADEPAPQISQDDQLQAMGRALRAKFDPQSAPTTGVTDIDVDVARSEVASAQQRADEAAHRLSTARRRIQGFETELTARSNDDEARDARHDAAVALEAQVFSLEMQLSETEASARDEVEEASRALSRAEIALERLRHEVRARCRRITELVGLVPDVALPSDDEDLVDHAATIATSLRLLVEPMQADIEPAGDTVDALREQHEEKGSELERRRAGRDALLSEDRRTGLQTLLDGDPGPVVLDDVVAVDDPGLLLVADLDAIESSSPLVVVTTDRAVAGWAIELPYERGRVANASELWPLTGQDPAPTPTPPPTHPGQEPAPYPTTAGQHPAPSSTR